MGNYESVGGTLRVDIDANGNPDALTVIGSASFTEISGSTSGRTRGFNAGGHRVQRGTDDSDIGGGAGALLTVTVGAGGGTATTTGQLSALPTTVNVEQVAS